MVRTELMRARLLPQARGLLSAGPVRPGRARRAPVAPACRRRGGQGPNRRSKKLQSQAKQASQVCPRPPVAHLHGHRSATMDCRCEVGGDDLRCLRLDTSFRFVSADRAVPADVGCTIAALSGR